MQVAPKHSKPFFVACWYRPPTSGIDATAFENLRETLRTLDLEKKEIILIGDTNCDFKSVKDSNAKHLKAVYSEYQLQQMIQEYTRVAVLVNNKNEHKISKTLIDHFATNKPKYTLRADILETGMVDHYLIYGIRKLNARRLIRNKTQKVIESRSLKRYDKTAFQRDLGSIDWDNILGPYVNDPSRITAVFQEIYESLLNIHAPLKVKKVRDKFAPWLTRPVRNLMMEKDKLKKAAKKDPNLWSTYKKMRNKATNAIRIAVREHYQGMIEVNKDNPKKMWKTINNVLDRGSAKTSIQCLNVNGCKITEDKQMAEALNQHFVTVGPRLAEELKSKSTDDPLRYISCSHPGVMNFRFLTSKEINNSIKQLKLGKASGPDHIPVGLVKDASEYISNPLSLIYNASMSKGSFPDTWKIARVSPIFKSGAKDERSNYRPISVLSVLSRVFERIVHDQLLEFLKQNKILTKSQFAYRKLYSTITSLIDSIDHWLANSDNQKLNMMTFLDLKNNIIIIIIHLFKVGHINL